jgi:hypothetical protein
LVFWDIQEAAPVDRLDSQSSRKGGYLRIGASVDAVIGQLLPTGMCSAEEIAHRLALIGGWKSKD